MFAFDLRKHKDVHIYAESLSRAGRTDLKIESKIFGTKIFEFKVWGRNDHQKVISQIYGYLTDFENDGFVFMVNPNQKSIDDEYIKNLKSVEMGYIEDSFKRENIQNFEYFVSQHQIYTKRKTIYHFIYNIY
jgi:hypothetical protein